MNFVDTHFAAAYEVVKHAHATDVRADGRTPYISHVTDVAARVRPQVLSAHDLPLLMAALGHDVKEDHPNFPLRDRWLEAGIPVEFVDEAIATIDLLTNTFDSYLDYILSLKYPTANVPPTRHARALRIKEADMRSNWADLVNIPNVGQNKGRRDRHQLKISMAYYILFDKKII